MSTPSETCAHWLFTLSVRFNGGNPVYTCDNCDTIVGHVDKAGRDSLAVPAEAAAERDQLAETLRLRSEALDRVAAENERLRAVVAAVEALASDAIDAIGAAGHSHWRNGGPGGFCSACDADYHRRVDLRGRLTALAGGGSDARD